MLLISPRAGLSGQVWIVRLQGGGSRVTPVPPLGLGSIPCPAASLCLAVARPSIPALAALRPQNPAALPASGAGGLRTPPVRWEKEYFPPFQLKLLEKKSKMFGQRVFSPNSAGIIGKKRKIFGQRVFSPNSAGIIGEKSKIFGPPLPSSG